MAGVVGANGLGLSAIALSGTKSDRYISTIVYQLAANGIAIASIQAMAKVLMIHTDKCTGCQSCMLAACIMKVISGWESRIHVYTWEREGFSVPMSCQQCDTRQTWRRVPDKYRYALCDCFDFLFISGGPISRRAAICPNFRI